MAGNIRSSIVFAAAALLASCSYSRHDANGRTPTDVVRMAMLADERGDEATINRLSWFPPSVFEYEKRRAERRLKDPPGQPVVFARGIRLGKILGEYQQSQSDVYRVDYELTDAEHSYSLKNWRFVRRIGGEWRIVRSDAGEKYQVPVDEIGYWR